MAKKKITTARIASPTTPPTTPPTIAPIEVEWWVATLTPALPLVSVGAAPDQVEEEGEIDELEEDEA